MTARCTTPTDARGRRRAGRRLGVVGLLAVVALTGCASADPAPTAVARPVAAFDESLHARLPADVRARGELVVATDATYPPASAFGPDGRTIIGFEPDLAALLSRVLGIELQLTTLEFSRMLDALESEEIDLVMAAMTDTVERQERADFVDYFTAGTSILVQRGNPHGISDLRDLCGRVVAAERATVQVDLLQRTQASCGDDPIQVQQFPDNASALLELRTGRATAVLNDYPPASLLTTDARTSAYFQLASTAQYEPGFYGIAVRKSETALRDALREALDRVIRSGEYAEVLAEWDVSGGAVDRATVNGGAG